MVELRIGRVLKAQRDKQKMKNLVEMMENLKLDDKKKKEDGHFMKEAKAFITFLFYHFCKYLANNVRLKQIEREQGTRKPYLFEWKVDDTFWKDTFRSALLDMQSTTGLHTFSQAFYFFTVYEHPAQLENQDALAEMNLEIKCYVEKLFYQEGYTRMVELMHQQDQLSTRAFPVSDKKVYLNQLADDLARQLVHPIFYDYTPNSVSWPNVFKYSRSRCCYIPEVDGGCTVMKLPMNNFSMFPRYHYKILETKVTFGSSEKDIRKAFLLHQKLNENL